MTCIKKSESHTLLPMTVSILEIVVFFPVTSLKATQVYIPLMLKVKGSVINTEELATSESLNHQVNWLGGIESAEQLKTAACPISAKAGPSMTAVSGPSTTAAETTGSHGHLDLLDRIHCNIWNCQFTIVNIKLLNFTHRSPGARGECWSSSKAN